MSENNIYLESKSEFEEDKEKLEKIGKQKQGNKKLRVVIYCRVSTTADSQKSSFDNQEDGLKELVEKNENWQWVRTFGDNGRSGTSINRKSFVEMLEFCGIDSKTKEVKSKSNCDLIIVKNTSRFARNVGDSDAILKALFKNDVDVFFLDIGKLASDDTILVQILSVMDENESRDKSKKVRYGLSVAASHNRVRTNGKLFGYTYDKTNKKLIKNPEEARIVSAVFKFYATGNYGVRRLANMLNSGDFGKLTDSKKVFSTSSLKKMLQNEKYAGLNNALKWTSGTIFYDKHSPRVQKDYELKRCEDIEQIVDEDTFFKCQEIMKSRVLHYKTDHSKLTGKNSGVSRFGGRIICGNCGHNYIRNVDKNNDGSKRYFYNCSYKKKAGVSKCNSSNVTDSEIIDMMMKECVQWHILMSSSLYFYIDKCLDYLISVYSNDEQFENDVLEMNKNYNKAKEEYEEYQKLILRLGVDNATDKDIETLKSLRRTVIEMEKILNENSNAGRRTLTKQWILDCKNKLLESCNRDVGVDELIDICEKVIIHTEGDTIETRKKYIEFRYGTNFNLLPLLDDNVNNFHLDDYNCCHLFTRIKSYDYLKEWLERNPNLTIEDIERLNNDDSLFDSM